MQRAFIVVAGLSAGTVGATPLAMKPGLWEITTSSELSGLPLAMPPTTIKRCYTADDIKDLRRTIPKRSDCKVAEWNQSGNTITWKASCTGSTPATMTGSMKFAGVRSSGVGTISVHKGGQLVQVNQKYNGHRIGDCK